MEALETQRPGYWTTVKHFVTVDDETSLHYEADLARAMSQGGPFHPFLTEDVLKRTRRLDLHQHYVLPFFDLSDPPSRQLKEGT